MYMMCVCSYFVLIDDRVDGDSVGNDIFSLLIFPFFFNGYCWLAFVLFFSGKDIDPSILAHGTQRHVFRLGDWGPGNTGTLRKQID